MNGTSGNPVCRLLLLMCGLAAPVAGQADALAAVQLLRQGGCGGILPAALPLQHNVLLDRAAAQWAAGAASTPAVAAERSGYRAEFAAGLHINGPEAATVLLLRRSSCRIISDPGLHDLGIYHRGFETWLVLASAYGGPPRSQKPLLAAPVPMPPARSPLPQTPLLAARALELVNQVRARGTRCGDRSFGPVPPIKLSGTLAEVAFGHAMDMARHNYFEHEDLAGRSPADRVRAVGYQEKLVGENIAYGPKSAEEVVQGWLDSPGHCENIMDGRFAEMGIAYAAGQASKRGLYWVQLLAAPRA